MKTGQIDDVGDRNYRRVSLMELYEGNIVDNPELDTTGSDDMSTHGIGGFQPLGQSRGETFGPANGGTE